MNKRNWYQQIVKNTKCAKNIDWQVRLPKSKWDSEEDETLLTKVAKGGIEKQTIIKSHISPSPRK